MPHNVSPTYTFTVNEFTVDTYHRDSSNTVDFGFNGDDAIIPHHRIIQVHSGKLTVAISNTTHEITKNNNPVLIRSGTECEIKVVEDGTIFCDIYSTR